MFGPIWLDRAVGEGTIVRPRFPAARADTMLVQDAAAAEPTN
jgi:hypothetical protein